MKKYAKITNEKTKQVEVGTGTNEAFYQSIGMEKMDVEQAYNGDWYLLGYAPEKPASLIAEEEISELKQKLSDTDYKCLKYVDGALTDEEYAEVKSERQSLRDRINELEEQLKELDNE
jgi:hypothetical protein